MRGRTRLSGNPRFKGQGPGVRGAGTQSLGVEKILRRWNQGVFFFRKMEGGWEPTS